MPKVVQIPGVGNVEFPDSMSDDDIGKAAQQAHTEANAPPPTQQGPIAKYLIENHPTIAKVLGLAPATDKGQQDFEAAKKEGESFKENHPIIYGALKSIWSDPMAGMVPGGMTLPGSAPSIASNTVSALKAFKEPAVQTAAKDLGKSMMPTPVKKLGDLIDAIRATPSSEASAAPSIINTEVAPVVAQVPPAAAPRIPVEPPVATAAPNPTAAAVQAQADAMTIQPKPTSVQPRLRTDAEINAARDAWGKGPEAQSIREYNNAFKKTLGKTPGKSAPGMPNEAPAAPEAFMNQETTGLQVGKKVANEQAVADKVAEAIHKQELTHADISGLSSDQLRDLRTNLGAQFKADGSAISKETFDRALFTLKKLEKAGKSVMVAPPKEYPAYLDTPAKRAAADAMAAEMMK